MAVSAISVSRRNLVQDFRRRYVVFIDGAPVGHLAPYRTSRFEVAPGQHRVWARRPDTGDAAEGDVVVNIEPGEICRLSTTSRLRRLPFGELLRAVGDAAWGALGKEML